MALELTVLIPREFGLCSAVMVDSCHTIQNVTQASHPGCPLIAGALPSISGMERQPKGLMVDMNRVFRNAALLPHLPEVVMDLDRVTRGDDLDTREIVAVVSKDPVVAAKVLRLANSAFYARKGGVSSLEHALRIVGMSDFRTMVIASSALSAVATAPGLDLQAHWSHSSLAGSIASAITEQVGGPDPSAAFVAGLLHSIGTVLIHVTLPEEAALIEAEAPALDFLARVKVERARLGFDHAQVGGELLRRWRLPENLVSAVSRYPGGSMKDGSLPVAVFCGSISATGAMAGVPPEAICETIGEEPLRALGLDKAWLADEVKRSTARARELVAVLR